MLKFKLCEYIPYKTIGRTVGSISSYLSFIHQSKATRGSGTARMTGILPRSGKCHSSPEAAAIHEDAWECPEVNPHLKRSTEHRFIHPSQTAEISVWCKKTLIFFTCKEATTSTSCIKEEEIGKYFGSHRPSPWRRAEKKILWSNNYEALTEKEVWKECQEQEEDTKDANRQ